MVWKLRVPRNAGFATVMLWGTCEGSRRPPTNNQHLNNQSHHVGHQPHPQPCQAVKGWAQTAGGSVSVICPIAQHTGTLPSPATHARGAHHPSPRPPHHPCIQHRHNQHKLQTLEPCSIHGALASPSMTLAPCSRLTGLALASGCRCATTLTFCTHAMKEADPAGPASLLLWCTPTLQVGQSVRPSQSEPSAPSDAAATLSRNCLKRAASHFGDAAKAASSTRTSSSDRWSAAQPCSTAYCRARQACSAQARLYGMPSPSANTSSLRWTDDQVAALTCPAMVCWLLLGLSSVGSSTST